MDRWLDSLSEDWVSQPRPSPAPSILNGSPSVSDSSNTCNTSRSRIPRLKLRSGSTSAANLSSTTKRASQAEGNSQVLSERTSSTLNLRPRRSLEDATKLDGKLPISKNTLRSSRAFSDSSLQSVQYHTVQHKLPSSSPKRDGQRHETPEWKRRALKGEVGYGEQRDLFGPMGLENIFKPATTRSRPPQKKTRGFRVAKDDEFPSSPPPYTLAKQSQNPSSILDTKHLGQGALDALEEEEEEHKRSCEDDGDRSGRPERKQDSAVYDAQKVSRQDNGCPLRSSQDRTPRDVRGASQNRDSRYEDRSRAIIRRAEDQDADPPSNSLEDHVERSRTISGQEEWRNEKFSPVVVSTHNTVDGNIDYAALDLSYQHLSQQIGSSGLQESLRPSTRSSDHDVQYGHSDDQASPEHRLHDWISQSLPDDLSTSTEVFASKGGFINVRRGGYSNDGSFQRRRLSPSSLPGFDESDILANRRLDSGNDRSLLSSPVLPGPALAVTRQALPSAPATSPVLKTPTTSPTRGGANPAKQESSGSPLKLFGDYDTFTNDRLLRRMSQFQVSSPEDVNEEENYDVHGLGRTRSMDGPMCAKTRNDLIIGKVDNSALATGLLKQITRASSFGEGQLHGYEFKEEVSIMSSRSISKYHGSETQPTLLEMNHGAEMRVAIHLERSPEFSGSGQFRQRKSNRSSTRNSSTITRQWVAEIGPAHRRNTAKHSLQRQKSFDERQEVEGQMKGKRPPNSPAKDPAPKRRRTSDTVGSEFYREDVDAVEQRSQQMQSIIGRKRKDARYDSNDPEADPKIIALRQMLCPRTPTTSQHRRQGQRSEAIEGIISGTPKPRKQTALDRQVADLTEAAEGIEAQTQAVAAELATFAVHAAENITTDSRKPSITTQDFINEATKVMNIIRAKGKPPSGLASIEQSEAEDAAGSEQAYDDQSTKDEFSRPPSREGVSLRILRGPKQLDPRVLSHLRKFEEKDEVDVIITSSLKSLDIDRHGNNTLNATDCKKIFISETEVESEPSNIRILENVQAQRKRKHSSSSVQEDMTGQSHHEVRSHASQPSSGPSTGRSIPTGSSRSSGNKALIAPEKVSHLIPAQAAGMTYDHVQQTWVKRKGSEVHSVAGSNKPTSEATDDDPFEHIPDLSVDELEELKRIQTLAIQIKDGVVNPVESSGIGWRDSKSKEEQPSGGSMEDSRPRTSEGIEEVPFDTSSVPSRYSHLASSQQITETRATSWDDEDHATKVHPEKHQERAEAKQPSPGDREEEVEHEISILGGRLSKTPTRPDHLKHRARVVTVAFSSPLVNHVQKDEYEESPDRDPRMWNESCESIVEDSCLGHFSGLVQNQRSASKRTPAGFAQRSAHCSTARRVSFGGQSFTARPVSRIDELNEVSFSECHGEIRRQSHDLAVSTPLPVPSSAGRQSNFSFHLSPLPDFTVHQLDESLQLDINHVAKRNAHLSVKDVEGSFSLAVQELVKKVTDVEPYEPYWDYIRQLDLQGQGLITLHLLREFCARIEDLDVADNELGQLNGAPSTIRNLRIQRNCLSSLTAWGHMSNLQYLDVSGNQIENLDGFSGLIHLRELRADDNKISNIEGIFDLDGLITLRLRRNSLETVDFEGAELYVYD